ncbi:MAG: GGDEF domain-containing protein, partial [Vulcanimicrobiaceae bacterium]
MFNAGPAYVLACEREADRADATYDSLTGLLTPRAFRNRLHVELSDTPTRPGMTASLWFIDTDHFKHVNDGFGHAAGDVVLQGMADVLRAHTIVDLDIAGRNGGDEFCALIRESQKTVAIERAHALCIAIREREFGIPVKITASIGVATFPRDARTSNDLLELADAAMYHSKRQGRDRVSFALDGETFTVYR